MVHRYMVHLKCVCPAVVYLNLYIGGEIWYFFGELRRNMSGNILIIKHGALGDVVLAMGAMQEIRRRNPGARITLLTMEAFVSFVRGVGVFDDFIIDNRRAFVNPRATGGVISSILRGRYSEIYDLQHSQRTRGYFRLLRWCSPAGEWRWYDSLTDLCHVVRKNFRLGPGSDTTEPGDVPKNLTDLSGMHGEGKHFDMLPPRYVLLIPGCSPKNSYKRWPVENFREIVRRLHEHGIPVVLLGTRAEEQEALAICRGFPTAVNMIGLTSLADVPQVARRALAVFGNDTGPSHMASLAGAYTIAVYDCRNACGALRGPNSVNLISEAGVELITPNQVWEHMRKIVDNQ